MNSKLTKIMDKMTPQYSIKLPISKQMVNYRPFLVKEEKLMLIGMEDEAKNSMKAQYKMIQRLLESCTDINDIESLPLSEIELLFLKLRSKSVNNMVKLDLKAENGKDIEFEVDLETVEIEGELPDPKLMVTDDVGVLMTPPTLYSLLQTSDESQNPFDEILNVIKTSIIQIFTEDTVIKKEELSVDEMEDFVDNLPASSLEKLSEYFDNLPKLQKEVEYKIGNKKKTLVLAGINDFLA
jgi:hypothetical protein